MDDSIRIAVVRTLLRARGSTESAFIALGPNGRGPKLPGVLFKYTALKYAAALATLGLIRVGTLADFRGIEHGVRSDCDEGVFREKRYYPELFLDAPPEDPFLKRAIRIDPGAAAGGLYFSDLRVSNAYPGLNFHALCLSTKDYSADEANAIDPNYNSCVRIDDPGGFIRSLSQGIAAHGFWVGGDMVSYGTREPARGFGPRRINPAFIKDPKFSHEAEWRGLWYPLSSVPKPFNVLVPELARYCTLLY